MSPITRLWRQHGRPADARERLAAAHAWFTEGFGTPDLADAQAMLEEQALKRWHLDAGMGVTRADEAKLDLALWCQSRRRSQGGLVPPSFGLGP